MKNSITIQTPTPGRVVLYAPDKMLDAVLAEAAAGARDPELQVFPATVLRHDGAGQVRLSVHGFPDCIFTARFGEIQPGEPPVGHWCYPPMSRDTVEVENEVTAD